MMEEDIDPGDHHTREMYARYGLAMYFAQVVGAGIRNALAMAELADAQFIAIDVGRRHPDLAQRHPRRPIPLIDRETFRNLEFPSFDQRGATNPSAGRQSAPNGRESARRTRSSRDSVR